jgi:hypothetical protein
MSPDLATGEAPFSAPKRRRQPLTAGEALILSSELLLDGDPESAEKLLLDYLAADRTPSTSIPPES